MYRASRTVNQIFRYYLDGKHGFRTFRKDLREITGILLISHNELLRMRNKSLRQFNTKAKASMSNDLEISSRIQNKNTILMKTTPKDLIALNTLQNTCSLIHVRMTYPDQEGIDVRTIKRHLILFLICQPIPFKIHWLLKTCPLSDEKLGKLVGIDHSQITRYRTGKQDIGHMSLNHAQNLDELYCNVVKYQVHHSGVSTIRKSDIEHSFLKAELDHRKDN